VTDNDEKYARWIERPEERKTAVRGMKHRKRKVGKGETEEKRIGEGVMM